MFVLMIGLHLLTLSWIHQIVESCRLVGSRPHMIGIDDKACFQRVKFLLESVDGSDAFYYAPPSAEETMAASALGRMGLNS